MPLIRPVAALLNASRKTKIGLLMLLDTALILLALWLSYFLRLDTFYIENTGLILLGLAAPVIAIPLFIRNELYRAVIRYLAADVVWAVLRAVTLYVAVWALVVLFSGVLGVPRSVILILSLIHI